MDFDGWLDTALKGIEVETDADMLEFHDPTGKHCAPFNSFSQMRDSS